MEVGRDFCENPVFLEKIICPVCGAKVEILHGEVIDEDANWWWKAVANCKCGWRIREKERIIRAKEVVF